MAEGISPQRLFHRDPESIEENQGEEIDSGPKRAILGFGIEVFLEDYRGKLGYKIPEGKKLEVFFIIQKEEKEPPFIKQKVEEEKKEKGEEDGRIRCRVMDLYRENEKGEYINDLDELQLEKQDSKAAVKKGSEVWCYPEDLEKNLKPKEEQKEEESKIIEFKESEKKEQEGGTPKKREWLPYKDEEKYKYEENDDED